MCRSCTNEFFIYNDMATIRKDILECPTYASIRVILSNNRINYIEPMKCQDRKVPKNISPVSNPSFVLCTLETRQLSVLVTLSPTMKLTDTFRTHRITGKWYSHLVGRCGSIILQPHHQRKNIRYPLWEVKISATIVVLLVPAQKSW